MQCVQSLTRTVIYIVILLFIHVFFLFNNYTVLFSQQFLESMYMKYDRQAADNGAYIVGSSGFDSIPADLGVLFTRNSVQGNNLKILAS